MEINITITKDDGTQIASSHEHVPNALAFLTSLFPEGSAAHDSAPEQQPAAEAAPATPEPTPAAPSEPVAVSDPSQPAAAGPAAEDSQPAA